MTVPWPVVCVVGRTFFRAVRTLPFLFPLVMAIGLAICVWIFVAAIDSKPFPPWFLKTIGLLGISFYGGLLIMFLMKRLHGTWDEFCEWGYCIFDSE